MTPYRPESTAPDLPEEKEHPVIPAISHAVTAAPLAALLPARRGEPWKVEPAPYAIRPNAATSRLTNRDRALIVVEQAGRIEVYADRHDLFPVTPDAVADAADHGHLAALAARILRHILPSLARESIDRVRRERGQEGVMLARAEALQEVYAALAARLPQPPETGRGWSGPGLAWKAASGGQWSLDSTLAYDGPVHGLYALLPVLLPSPDGQEPADVGSVFTRHLTDRFPQLRPLNADEVEFGRFQDVNGYIALPAKDEPTDYADDNRRVVAEFGAMGVDLLLTVVPHLV